MRMILLDLDHVDKKVTDIEMRFNPKPHTPQPQPVQIQIQQSPRPPSPTRNYFPPGYQAAVHFNDEANNLKGVLKQQQSPNTIALQPS